MNTPALEVVAPTRNAVGESPMWHAGEGAVYWTDIPAKAVYRLDVSSGVHTRYDVAEMVGCLALADDGGLIAATRRGVARLGIEGDRATLDPIDDVAYPRDGMRANDGRCDRQGRFWFGTMLMDMAAAQPVGGLYCHTGARGLDGPRIDGLIVQNGLAFSPDGRTMYLSDSHASVRRVWAFDFDPDDGAMSNRRPFVDMNAHPGRPDGAAVDAEGCYWVAMFEGQRLLRFAPSGELLREVRLPVRCATMPCFGAADLKTIYITTARENRPPAELADQPFAGCVLALSVDVPGLPVNFAAS